jgi:transposase
MRNGLIYIIKNKINSKVYIGQTKQSLADRWNGHMKRYRDAKTTYKLYNAMRKYGCENFYYELVVDDIPEEQLDQKEREIIEQYDSYYNGYNSTKGGDGNLFEDLDEHEIVSLYLSGLSSVVLAKSYDVSWRTIIRILDKHSIKRNDRSYIDDNEFVEMYLNGIPLKEIADHFGVDIKTVGRKRNKLGLPKRKKQREDVETIRKE